MAKMNGSAAWIRLGLYILGLVAALAIAWGGIGHAVEDNAEDIKMLTPKVDAALEHVVEEGIITPIIQENIKTMQADIQSIEQNMATKDDIREMIEEVHRE